jgi:3-hydroxyisobutyrate dehydrogenase
MDCVLCKYAGNMGASMAKNLKKNFDSVEVYDISADNVKGLTDVGATKAASVKAMAASCDVIITMVPATPHVVGLMRGSEGIFANARKGTMIIDSSTIDPITSRELINEARSKGLRMLDAPVSGGVTGAAAGTLTFMVGGSKEDLDSAQVTNGVSVFICSYHDVL